MVAAFVLIKVTPDAGWSDAAAMHGAMHAVPGVKTVHFVAGPTDIIAFVEVADQKAMMETIGKLRAIKGVFSTDSRIVWPV